MKCLFVCEFITCGGMRNLLLPDSLLADAEMMYQALLADLRQLGRFNIITCRDKRLSPVAESIACVDARDDPWQVWKRCMQKADLTWLIAPETDDTLIRLHQLAGVCECRLIGCDNDAVELTTSKLRTNTCLLEQGIPAMVCSKLDNDLLPRDSARVVKPDDGAGTEECYFFDNREDMLSWEKSLVVPARFIQQRYMSGTPASLSVLYAGRQTRLLAANRQIIEVDNGRLVNRGVLVNDLHKQHARLERLAVEIGRLIPGLRGYAGIDLLIRGQDLIVMEINPRLTTAYAGLSASLGFNVAGLIIDALACCGVDIDSASRDNTPAEAGIRVWQ